MTIINTILFIIIAIAMMVGSVMMGHQVALLIRSLYWKREKEKIKTAMALEARYNELYEEALYENVDEIVRKTLKAMEEADT